MPEKYFQAVGRRKSAVAQVRLIPGGSGKVVVNARDINTYFGTAQLRRNALAPLREIGKLETMDVEVRAVGGGPRGQADAVKLGIARALVMQDETLKKTLKAHAFLTRDARKKERKKFGRRGARRGTQWRKR